MFLADLAASLSPAYKEETQRQTKITVLGESSPENDGENDNASKEKQEKVSLVASPSLFLPSYWSKGPMETSGSLPWVSPSSSEYFS